MDAALPSFVLGYHGCDRALAEDVFAGRRGLAPSTNDYDWLGDGVYFWEHNAERAFQFAAEVAGRPRNDRQRIAEPAVVGAVIDLGHCLNLLDAEGLGEVREAHEELREFYDEIGEPLPRNTGGPDLLRRELDCTVIRFVHEQRHAAGLPPYKTVRSVFPEGEPLYEAAGFRDRNHIQLAVRDPGRLLGYFRPLGSDGLARDFAGGAG